ncbi:MAG: (Na+)-NQR maturation NqrM [Gammaproteobacteria bacterium]|nr:(Na+)-NQR maturation NqrM [Gammaproteobacteria bacterium]
MNLFFASFVIIGLAVIGMAIGVIISDRRIKGSCGGLNTIEGLESACDICETPCERRRKALAQQTTNSDSIREVPIKWN